MSVDAGSSLGAAIAPLTLVTEDGYPLAATRYRARAPLRGVVVIAPATGVRMRYYAAFAEFLAGAGFEVLTWDWRGIGDSRHEARWRDRRLTMRAWGERDLTAAICWAARRDHGAPVFVVGHSFGGQALGLAANTDRVSRAVLVAAQHGWAGHWSLRGQLLLRPLWHLAMPLLATVLGRFPSSWFGLGEDLPCGVARDWAAWGRRRARFGPWAGHAAVRSPLLVYSVSDDRFAPPRAVEALIGAYAGAKVRHRRLRPEEFGVATLGHWAFFREGVMPSVWADVAEFLGGGDAS
ncbi:MAG: alpha/beta fold hydrolase [Gemmatimonadetes bacterium]|nr:alpha/beta fold hydrolase [Gemmatimonadota bacterium]